MEIQYGNIVIWYGNTVQYGMELWLYGMEIQYGNIVIWYGNTVWYYSNIVWKYSMVL